MVTDRSALLETVVVVVPVLLFGLGSLVVVLTVAELVNTVLFGVLAFTFTTRVNCALAPVASVVAVAVTVPVPPTGTTSVRVQPPGTVKDTNVVPAGKVSEKLRPLASLGPLFVAVIV